MQLRKTHKNIVHLILLSMIVSIGLCACATKVSKKPIAKEVIGVKTETPNEPTTSQLNDQNNTNPEDTINEYMSKVLNMSGEAQKKELQNLIQSQQGSKQDVYSKTKLALLYGLSSSRVRDYAKAQLLADELIKERTLDSERKSILIILRDYIAETIKISIKLREEQKKSDALQAKFDILQTRADTVQQKADNLQQKLDELKDIEKTMIIRNQNNKK